VSLVRALSLPALASQSRRTTSRSRRKHQGRGAPRAPQTQTVMLKLARRLQDTSVSQVRASRLMANVVGRQRLFYRRAHRCPRSQALTWCTRCLAVAPTQTATLLSAGCLRAQTGTRRARIGVKLHHRLADGAQQLLRLFASSGEMPSPERTWRVQRRARIKGTG
jgi:hypothetical protein